MTPEHLFIIYVLPFLIIAIVVLKIKEWISKYIGVAKSKDDGSVNKNNDA